MHYLVNSAAEMQGICVSEIASLRKSKGCGPRPHVNGTAWRSQNAKHRKHQVEKASFPAVGWGNKRPARTDVAPMVVIQTWEKQSSPQTRSSKNGNRCGFQNRGWLDVIRFVGRGGRFQQNATRMPLRHEAHLVIINAQRRSAGIT